MAIIAVFNQKGGVGKTTTTVNLAAALARMGRRPIVIDLDPQAHLTLSLGAGQVAPEQSISMFFRETKTLTELVRQVGDIRLVPAHLDLSKIEALQAKSASAARRLRQGLAEAFPDETDPILIDCCPTLGVLSLNAILACDRVLVPVSADFLSMQGVNKLDIALKALEGPLNRKIEKRVVLTRFDARRKLSFDIFDHLKERFGDALCDTRIVENVALAASPAAGKDIFSFAPSSPGARDYANLAQELSEKAFFS